MIRNMSLNILSLLFVIRIEILYYVDGDLFMEHCPKNVPITHVDCSPMDSYLHSGAAACSGPIKIVPLCQPMKIEIGCSAAYQLKILTSQVRIIGFYAQHQKIHKECCCCCCSQCQSSASMNCNQNTFISSK